MGIEYNITQWILSVGEILTCYYFMSIVEASYLLSKKRRYVLLWSLGVGTALTINRDSDWGMVSWIMLIFQSIVISISLWIKLKKHKLHILGIVMAYNVSVAFLQLFF